MPDALSAALATPGLPWIVLVTIAAGVVYGFAGFGAALVYMPVATAFVPPQLAISTLALVAVSSLVTIVPRAWARVDRAQTAGMIATAALTIPLGIAVLRVTDPLRIRWALTVFTTATLVALVTGWRRRGRDTLLARTAVAGVSGFTGGAVGINGPIMVLFHLSGQGTAEQTRANTIVFLSVTGFMVLPMMAVQGLIDGSTLALGVLLMVPYAAGNLFGQWLFRPDLEWLYRRAAYAIIGMAVVLGLPIWDRWSG